MSSSLKTQKPQTTVSLGVTAELTAGGESVILQLEQTHENGIKVLRGGMLPEQRLLLVSLIRELIPEIPPLDSMEKLAITELALEVRPDYKTQIFQLGIANAWSLQLDTESTEGPLNFSVDKLFIELRKAPQEKSLFFLGEFSILGGTFDLSVRRIVASSGTTSQQWIFIARAENIQLATLVNRLLGDGKLTSEFSVQDLMIQSLELELTQTKTTTGTISHYGFSGSMTWAFTLAGEPFQISAAANIIQKQIGAQKQLSGKIIGSVSLFDLVEASIFYEFSKGTTPASTIGFEITIKSFTIRGTYSKTQKPAVEKVTFEVNGSINFGDLISYVVSLYDPSLDEFELDAPWDELGKQSINFNELEIEINLTTRKFTFFFKSAKSFDFGFFKVSNLGLSYGRIAGTSEYRPQISLDLLIPGQPRQSTAWDPVNDNPPNIPGKGLQVFDLQFLAVGQRVTFHPDIVARARNINQVMTVLRQTMGVLPPAKRRSNPLLALQEQLPSPAPVSIDPTATITIPEGTSPIQFDANSGILLGAQFSIMDTIDMSVIFNDPLIYGLRISLYGAKAKLFAGLQFEVLYRRISDTVGVYHIELALPDAMRQFDVGALSVTLPIVVVDIYTNGDFALDFGFPWRGDFSRSFAIQGFAGPFPVLGAGGFYFAKLSAETATSTPSILNGTFSPVYEFGLGLKIGFGRTFNKSILRAEISITIQGVIQGVVARFNPSDTSVASDDYFKIQGGVSLVGRLYGVVDFGVISVDVEVLLRATVLFVVEAYKPTEIILEAFVSVRASIKIAFVRIRFSFKLRLRQSFTLGSAKATPWKLGTPTPSTSNVAARRTARLAPAAFATPVDISTRAFDAEPMVVDRESSPLDVLGVSAAASSIDRAASFEAMSLETESPQSQVFSISNDQTSTWTSVKLQDPIQLDLYFQPGFTQVDGKPAGVSLLFIENSIEDPEAENPSALDSNPDNVGANAAAVDTDFDELAKALLKWTVYNYLGLSAAVDILPTALTLTDWEGFYTRFNDEFSSAAAMVDFLDPLYQFLEANFVFEIADRPVSTTQQTNGLSGTLFPMLPQLLMTLDQSSSINFRANDFSRDLQQIQQIKDYFSQLQIRPNNTTSDSSSVNTGSSTSISITDYLFADYFLLLIRSGLQGAVDYLEEQEAFTQKTVEEVLTELNQNGTFNHLASSASRYFLHGLRLPMPTVEPMVDWVTTALYEASGQQFEIGTTTQTVGTGNSATQVTTVTLDRIVLSKSVTMNWVRFTDYDQTNPNQTPTRDASSLVYVLSDDQKDFLRQLATDRLVLDQQPSQLAFYEPTDRQYTLKQRVEISNGRELRELPAELRVYLQDAQAQGFAFDLSVSNTASPSAQTIMGTWSTKIKVTVRRLATGHVYQLVGTDEAGQDLLEAMLTTHQALHIDLLYLDGNTSQLVAPTREVLVLKTNLSTRRQASGVSRQATDPTALYQAELPLVENDDGTDFIQILWECSTVNSGGYYLAYGPEEGSGLPDALFTDGVTADLVLVVQVNNRSQQAYSFHNCVELMSQLEDDVLATRANQVDRIQVLQMPAGHVGLQLKRAIAPPDDTSAIDDLANLYQLLGYRLLKSDPFEATRDGLPIGPSDDTSGTEPEWLYERVIPAYTLATARSSATHDDTLPSLAASPYRGIEELGQLRPQLEWRDVYGNILTTVTPTPLPVRYFDPLLGLNQWPSLVERYRFSAGEHESTVQLILSLQLDPSQYIPTPGNLFEEVKRKTGAARDTYQQVFYQIHQKDVTATAQTSVLLQNGTSVKQSVDTSVLTGFVETAYRYLDTLDTLTLLTYTVPANTTFLTIAEQFQISLQDLAEENQQVETLWPVGTVLNIPVERDILPADGLDSIAREALRAEAILARYDSLQGIATATSTPEPTTDAIAAKRRLLVERHRDTPGLILNGLLVETADQSGTYETQPGDTLADITRAAGYSSINTLVTALEKQFTTYLDADVTLVVPLDYIYGVHTTDTLASIQAKVQAVFSNTSLTIALDARLLTVTDITIATATTLNTGLTLTIPQQLAFIDSRTEVLKQPMVSTAAATLAASTQRLNNSLTNHQQIDAVAIATTNQTLAGLIRSGESLMLALSKLLGQDTNITDDTVLRTYLRPYLADRTDPEVNKLLSQLTTVQNDTFHTLTARLDTVRENLNAALSAAPEPIDPITKTEADQLRERLSRTLSLAQVAIATQNLPILKADSGSESLLIIPPYAVDIPLTFNLTTTHYPDTLIFPITVQLTLQRDPAFLSENVPDQEIVRQSTAYLSPHMSIGDTRSVSLQLFAKEFQATFAGLRLATSDHRNPAFPGDPNHPSSQSLWAVRLGKNSLLNYQIANPQQTQPPRFFAPAPLANTLMAGTVKLSETESKRFDAIDLNLLGQSFLRAVEDFLAPEVAIPVIYLGEGAQVDTVLDAKTTLADAISAQVVSLLQPTLTADDEGQQKAAAALQQELNVNLADAYAIETIIQYDVSVTGTPPQNEKPVCLVGQPNLVGARSVGDDSADIDLSTLDFTLSPAKIPLISDTTSSPYLTFFFNTQNPSRYEKIELDLTFSSNELEYNITDLDGVEGYQASDWLSFIEPLTAEDEVPNTDDTLGTIQIPIPLRTYPIPPSLVIQQAQLDPDSRQETLAEVRQWQYVYTYEHLDVAQDSLESDVRYNLVGLPQPSQLGFVEDGDEETLFDALVRFNHRYPALKAVLEQIAAGTTDNSAETKAAIQEFARLVASTAIVWRTWDPVQRSIVPAGVDYTIEEQELTTIADEPQQKVVTIVAPEQVTLPVVQLPGFQLLSTTPENTSPAGFHGQDYRFQEKSAEAAALDPVFGESSIPDRTLMIQDRDIIAQQNAWSGIWLSRNRQLVSYTPTNPVFVFQTPQVRFSNWVTPLLVNDRPWNIADLSDTPQQTVLTHLQQLFKTVLPDAAPQPYGLRLDCRYSFAVATVGDEQLFSTVPVLLTPRVAIAQNTPLSSKLVTDIAQEIERWRQNNRPVEDQGRYQFTLNLFSGIDNDATLPLLKIEQLYIQQLDIVWPSA